MKSAAIARVLPTTSPPDMIRTSRSTTWSSAAASRGSLRASRTVTGSGRRAGPGSMAVTTPAPEPAQRPDSAASRAAGAHASVGHRRSS